MLQCVVYSSRIKRRRKGEECNAHLETEVGEGIVVKHDLGHVSQRFADGSQDHCGSEDVSSTFDTLNEVCDRGERKEDQKEERCS